MQSANICDTDRTEISVKKQNKKNIKASLTSTLKPEREKYANTNKSLFQKELKASISPYLKHTTHYQK